MKSHSLLQKEIEDREKLELQVQELKAEISALKEEKK